MRDWIVKQYHALLQIRDHPHAIAGGVAVGIFFGFAFVPMKTAFSILGAWLLRCSKMAAVIAVTAHDILFPVWPFILRWEYDIGFWILHHQWPEKIHIDKHHFRPEQLFAGETYRVWFRTLWLWIHDKTAMKIFAHIIGPMLIGSVIIGVPVAAVCYAITFQVAKRAQAARLEKGSQGSLISRRGFPWGRKFV